MARLWMFQAFSLAGAAAAMPAFAQAIVQAAPAPAAAEPLVDRWGMFGQRAGKLYARIFKPEAEFRKSDWVSRCDWVDRGQSLRCLTWVASDWDAGGKPFGDEVLHWDAKEGAIVDRGGTKVGEIQPDGKLVMNAPKDRVFYRMTPDGFTAEVEALKAEGWEVVATIPFVDMTPELRAKLRKPPRR